MGFLSLQFALFVAVSLILYYLLPKKMQWMVLLAASYTYYVILCNKYIFYILLTTISTYTGTMFLDRMFEKQKVVLAEKKEEWSREERKRYQTRMQKKARLVMILILLFNFGILGFLKYFPFVVQQAADLLSFFGLHWNAPDLGFLLPLGISFYTFQTMGYVIDVYQEKVRAEKNPARLALFVSFFPQIIQGPIAFYSDLAHQFYEEKQFQYERFKNGAMLVLWGIFKKMVIADRAVKMVSYITADPDAFSGTFVFLAALMYALQLYADFSGGIDICRGVAEMFGITMAENFRRPYFSKSLTEYWHRWHMTLGNWVRAYVFYPLSISKTFLNLGKWLKSRLGKHISKVVPTSLASVLTFLIIGLWHGANGKYIAFGLWNGGVIMIAELFRPVTERAGEFLKIRKGNKGFELLKILWTFLLVLVGYYFDIAASCGAALRMLLRSVMDFHITDFTVLSDLTNAGIDPYDYLVIFVGALVLFVVSVLQERSQKTMRTILQERCLPVQWLVLFAGIFAVLIFGYYGPDISPADFIYMQF